MTIEERIRHHSQGAARALADSLQQRKIDRLLTENSRTRHEPRKEGIA